MDSKIMVSWSLLSLIIMWNASFVVGGMSKPRKLYSGYKLIRVTNISSEYEDVIIQTLEHRDTVQLWRLPKVNNPVEFLVGQSRFDDVMEVLQEIKVEAQVIHSDVSILLDEEREKFLAPLGSQLSWDSYYDYQDMVDYFMNKTSSDKLVSLNYEIIGKTELGKDIYLYRISKNIPGPAAPRRLRKQGSNHSQPFKPAIWIDAGLQGRDWLAISTATYILNQLLSGNYNELLEVYDVYVLPLINIDGYIYTRSTDRFWAKNRGVRVTGRGCEGVNLDRNFALMYRGELLEIFSRGTGVAHNPCSDYYGGIHAHIEPEVTALSRAIWARREHISLYLSLQSYSQIWLIPRESSGINQNHKNDFDELVQLAEIGNEALEKRTGAKYLISSMENSQAEPPGKCIDWMKQIAGIKYSYGLKLSDDGTSHGYLVPPTQIKPVGEGVLAAVSAMALVQSVE